MDDYKLYLDKPNSFQCKLELEGASLKSAYARLIVEGSDKKYLFEGTILPSGECEIVLNRLGEILEDGNRGKLQLEVIADDVYFRPWESHYITDLSKRVRVEVATPREVVKKPSISVSIPGATSTSKQEFETLTENITKKLQKEGITLDNVKSHRPKVTKLVTESTKSCQYEHSVRDVIARIIQNLT